MAKKHEDAPEKVLGTGASGDPYDPAAGTPAGVFELDTDAPVVTETVTHAKSSKSDDAKDEAKDEDK